MVRPPRPEVRIWGLQDRRFKKDGEPFDIVPKSPFVVRWRVGRFHRCKAFSKKGHADQYRAQLLTAWGDGELFDEATGEPVAWRRTEHTFATWARTYIFEEWPLWRPNTRRTSVEAIERAMVLLAGRSGVAVPAGMREYIRDCWLNPNAVGEHDPSCASWLARWSLPIDSIDRERAASAWVALARGDQGQLLAPETANRNRRALRACFNVAVERGVIGASPLPRRVDKRTGKAKEHSAKRLRPEVLPNEIEACELLTAVVNHQPRSWVVYGFLGTIYYCGLRPFEVAGLRPTDIDLPQQGWGELNVCGGIPAVAARWFDEGEERRTGPKGQAADHPGRVVPVPPLWVSQLRHIFYRCPPTGDVLFSTRAGTPLTYSNINRAWKRAKECTLEPLVPRNACSTTMIDNPLLATRVYDLRHACATTMLNKAKVPLPEIARRLGHSTDVLVGTYLHCLTDDATEANTAINDVLGKGRLPPAPNDMQGRVHIVKGG